jgi:hypothetical protein
MPRKRNILNVLLLSAAPTAASPDAHAQPLMYARRAPARR